MAAAVGVVLRRAMGARAGEGSGVRVGRYPHGRRGEGAAKRRHLERRKREKERRGEREVEGGVSGSCQSLMIWEFIGRFDRPRHRSLVLHTTAHQPECAPATSICIV